MATPPTFTSGAVLTAAQMNSVGLWLVKTQTVGSAVSSVTVTGAFSSDYDNYLILMSGGTSSAACSVGIEIGGAVNNYYGFMTYGDAATNIVQGAGRNSSLLMNWVGGSQGASQAVHVSVQVMNPFKTLYTKFANGTYQNAGAYGTMQGEHRVATSYTSFKLVPDAGTISNGTVFVYGYKGTV
jgi:hypothetical protein